jgi:DMSO/TMAO reductase YedYZ molybdopterin-dependent catalytic subunit
MKIDRRAFVRLGAVGLGGATAGCGRIGGSPAGADALSFQNWLTYRVQRWLFPGDRLAQEFPESAISSDFRANGTTNPPDPDYQALARDGFKAWRLEVGGLVRNKLSLSLADIRAMPSRTQITRHDCVEGWSSIGKWTGAPLSLVLDKADVLPSARFVVFYCADSMDSNSIVSTNQAGSKKSDSGSGAAAAGADSDSDDGPAKAAASIPAAPAGSGKSQPTSADAQQAAAGDDDKGDDDDTDNDNDDADGNGGDDAPIDTHYYSSIDLVAARHPQTILAYEMNGKPLTTPYGAPLRVRVERQLGYKMPKYLMRLELVESFADIRAGKGGYWEDSGYDWFAGV